MVDIPKKITSWNLFVDGRGFAGIATKVTWPKLTHKTQEHRGGGMIGTKKYAMGLEAMEFGFVLGSYEPEPFRLMGFRQGGPIGISVRGAMQYYQDIIPVIGTIRGMISELDMGDWEAGGDSSLTCKMEVDYWKLVRGPETLVEIDVDNNIERYGDTDLQEAIRNILLIG